VHDRIMAELQAGVDHHFHRPGVLHGPGRRSPVPSQARYCLGHWPG
jgi:hypothetical protein